MRPFKYVIAGLAALCAITAIAQRTAPLGPPPVKQDAATTTPAPPATPPTSPQLTPEDVNAWLDGFMPEAIATGDIAGAVVVVVRDGQVLTQRGYGFSNVERRTPVDPERTLFRPGSISKLFTWTAVMQQVEQGRLDLDADVNRYLDFEIPARDGQPVTLRQILTHSAGFEEQAKYTIGFDRAAVPDYATLLRTIPERIHAPYTTPAYSNYATSLAGYIVERVSGEPFDDYVDRHILGPLGMRNSSFRQPLPARLQPMVSTGYTVASAKPLEFEIVGPAPAGSLSATGADMARFMIAHLNDGAGLLRPETARTMHTTRARYGFGPLNRMLLGFYEQNINGQRVISHGGDTIGFHSELFLFLDADVGLFVSFNSAGRGGASVTHRRALFEQFADRYFPAPRDTRRVPDEQAREHARLMAGNWTVSRRIESNFLNLTELLGQTSVGTGKDGELVLPFQLGSAGPPRRWVEVEPFVWHDLNSHEIVAAVVENGVPVRFSINTVAPFMMFDRVPWYRSSALLMPLLYFSIAALFLTALLWPIRWLVRRKLGATLTLERRPLISYRLVRGFAWLTVLVLVGWLVMLSSLNDLVQMGSSADGIFYTLQLLTWIALIGGFAVALWDLWQVWRGGGRRWWSKLWSVVLVLAAFVLLWIGWSFNLLSFGTNF